MAYLLITESNTPKFKAGDVVCTNSSDVTIECEDAVGLIPITELCWTEFTEIFWVTAERPSWDARPVFVL